MRVLNEARRIALADQYETEPGKIGLSNPGVVRRTNTGQQLPCERKLGNKLHFIDKYNNAFGDVLQDNLDVKFDETLPIAQKGFVLPPGLQVGLQP